jgi:prepilin-type N-terminal cleavage/methylation domain-containing protein
MVEEVMRDLLRNKTYNGKLKRDLRTEDDKGITLIELMVVLSIIAILSALAVPPFMDFLSKGKVEDEAGRLFENIKWAQIEAEKQGDVAMVAGVLRRRRIYVAIDENNRRYSVWRWQDTNGNGVTEAGEFDREFDTVNPVDEPIRSENLSKTKIGFGSTVNKKACNNENGTPSSGLINLLNCPDVICSGCKCIRFDGKGFNDGLNNASIYLTNDRYTSAIIIGVAGTLNMCNWNGTQWISAQ